MPAKTMTVRDPNGDDYDKVMDIIRFHKEEYYHNMNISNAIVASIRHYHEKIQELKSNKQQQKSA